MLALHLHHRLAAQRVQVIIPKRFHLWPDLMQPRDAKYFAPVVVRSATPLSPARDCPKLAGRRKPPEPAPAPRPRPEGAAEFLPQISFVVFHPATAQKLQVFLLEGLLSMMVLLARDVIAHSLALRRANCKCPIPVLPCGRTLADFLMDSARRYGL